MNPASAYSQSTLGVSMVGGSNSVPLCPDVAATQHSVAIPPMPAWVMCSFQQGRKFVKVPSGPACSHLNRQSGRQLRVRKLRRPDRSPAKLAHIPGQWLHSYCVAPGDRHFDREGRMAGDELGVLLDLPVRD